MVLSYKSFNLRRFFRWALGSRGGGTCPKCPPPLDTRLDSTKIQLEKNKEIGIEVTSGIRQGCTASTVLFKLITYKIIEKIRKSEGRQILGPKITCLFYADDGLILAKDKEKAERSIEIIREIGGKYGLQLNERKSQCILFNMKEKCEKNK